MFADTAKLTYRQALILSLAVPKQYFSNLPDFQLRLNTADAKAWADFPLAWTEVHVGFGNDQKSWVVLPKELDGEFTTENQTILESVSTQDAVQLDVRIWAKDNVKDLGELMSVLAHELCAHVFPAAKLLQRWREAPESNLWTHIESHVLGEADEHRSLLINGDVKGKPNQIIILYLLVRGHIQAILLKDNQNKQIWKNFSMVETHQSDVLRKELKIEKDQCWDTQVENDEDEVKPYRMIPNLLNVGGTASTSAIAAPSASAPGNPLNPADTAATASATKASK